MLTIDLSPYTANMFQAVSEATGRPLNEWVQEALERFLEDWEDQRDTVEAQQHDREFKESGELGIPWEDVRAEMDVKHGL